MCRDFNWKCPKYPTIYSAHLPKSANYLGDFWKESSSHAHPLKEEGSTICICVHLYWLCSHRISFGIFDDFHLLTAALFLSYCQPQWVYVISNGAFILNSTVTLDKLNFFQIIFIETLNKRKTPKYPSELKKYSHKLIIPLKI